MTKLFVFAIGIAFLATSVQASNMGKCPYKIPPGSSFQTIRKIQDKCKAHFAKQSRMRDLRDDFIKEYNRAKPSKRGTYKNIDRDGNATKYYWYYDKFGERYSMHVDM